MSDETPMDERREWVVVMHARSAVRFRSDDRLEIVADEPSTAPITSVRLRNAYFQLDGSLVFKGLIAEARGVASSAEEAVALLAPRAAPLLQVLSATANASVDEPDQLLIYAPPTATSPGRFVEQKPIESSMAATSIRPVDLQEVGPVFELLQSHSDENRLHRAMAHLRQALRALEPFNRVMSAEHLFIACENLDIVVFRRLCREAGLPPNGDSKHELAVAAGFAPVPNSRKHLNDFDSYLRVDQIFDGDKALYDALRKASDGFEHGFGDFGDIQSAAHKTAGRTFALVRRAILREIGLADVSPLFDSLYDEPLPAWQPRVEIIGTYTDDQKRDWPYFYGTSAMAEITGISDHEDGRRKDVSFKIDANGSSLLDGQTIGIQRVEPALPGVDDR